MGMALKKNRVTIQHRSERNRVGLHSIPVGSKQAPLMLV